MMAFVKDDQSEFKHPVRVDFMSARGAASYNCLAPHVFVSIRDVGSQPVNLPTNVHRLGELFLEVDDLDYPGKLRGREVQLFTTAHAVAILELVIDHPEAEVLLVNCMAGVSRSCAVAVGVDELLNNGRSYSELTSRGVPNLHVRQTVTALNNAYLNFVGFRVTDAEAPVCVKHCERGCCLRCPENVVHECSLRGKCCQTLYQRYASPADCDVSTSPDAQG